MVDSNATVDNHRDITPIHALTGCITVAAYFGIGKVVVVRVSTPAAQVLSYIGDTSRILSEVNA